MKLPDLPSSEEIKKEGGEVEILEPKVISDSVGCKHYFVLRTTREAECRKCGLILFLEAGDEVIDGQIKGLTIKKKSDILKKR